MDRSAAKPVPAHLMFYPSPQPSAPAPSNHQTSSGHNGFSDYSAGPIPPRTPSGRDHRTPAYKRHHHSRQPPQYQHGSIKTEPHAASYAAAAAASAPAKADAVNSDVSNPVHVPTWPATVDPAIKERAERGHRTRQYEKDLAGVRARGDALDVLRLSALVIGENEGSSEEVRLVLNLLVQVIEKHPCHPISKHLIQMGLLTFAQALEYCDGK
ncbi:hypothetical protein HDU90_003352 [Geranomyces variabilis]|nr:hypothetical protein HDU90_003352 [Geranomyces variabilis]